MTVQLMEVLRLKKFSAEVIGERREPHSGLSSENISQSSYISTSSIHIESCKSRSFPACIAVRLAGVGEWPRNVASLDLL